MSASFDSPDRAEYIDAAIDHWDALGYHIPHDGEWSLRTFYDRGLRLQRTIEAMDFACSAPWVNGGKWRYFCGIAWKVVRGESDTFGSQEDSQPSRTGT